MLKSQKNGLNFGGINPAEVFFPAWSKNTVKIDLLTGLLR
jgi:hypothetical protein